MKNFIKVSQQLDQKALPISCDEGVYSIVADIYLTCPKEFKMLVPCLAGFQMTVLESIYEEVISMAISWKLKYLGKKSLNKC